MTEWFERWFGEEYLQLYPHRDETDARQAVDLVAAHVPLALRRVLDLACGPGRHAVHLARLGAAVVGLDLSLPLLRRAQQLRAGAVGFARGDIRSLPFRSGSFHVVVNLFTSFGYFSDDSEHQLALAEVGRVLVSGGTFVLDYFHADAVRSGLVPKEEQMLGTQRVVVERRISPDGRFVLKDMEVTGDGRRFQERVRLFSPTDLEQLLLGAGLSVRLRFGGYDGRKLSAGSPRAILVASRA